MASRTEQHESQTWKILRAWQNNLFKIQHIVEFQKTKSKKKNAKKFRKKKANNITQRKVIRMLWDFSTVVPNSRRQWTRPSYFLKIMSASLEFHTQPNYQLSEYSIKSFSGIQGLWNIYLPWTFCSKVIQECASANRTVYQKRVTMESKN